MKNFKEKDQGRRMLERSENPGAPGLERSENPGAPGKDEKAQRRRDFLVLSFLSICGFISGCRCESSETAPMAKYFGPTETMDEVVSKINQNNEKIPTLRGEGSFDAVFNDSGKTRHVGGDVTLLYARPQSLLLRGKDVILGRIFELGSNDDRYWVIFGPSGNDQSRMWTGSYKNLDRVDVKRIPVRPDLVLEVLGLATVPTNFLQQPSPVMRFNNDYDAYMILWTVMLPDRWAAQKEIWYDRRTKLPIHVLLYDPNGRVVLSAWMSDHKPIEVSGLDPEDWPKVATNYRLFFPDTESRMTIDLNRALALSAGNPPAPNQQTFRFPGENAGVPNIIQLDDQAAQ